ncbi:hypothetical protein O181_018835 [Austropuccinia psidii MF-1]|uniref:Uncharacterized protein n=1 Tax=Austropuccinia psidii MF-1 TaxID=1389203 RepID=A0A9Q3C9F6_9BASI|nr:hypothetical protein [Austropuccinia psidii MF-1]
MGFFSLGVVFAVKQKNEIGVFRRLVEKLNELSLQWKPEDITNLEMIEAFSPLLGSFYEVTESFWSTCRVFFAITVAIISRLLSQMSKFSISELDQGENSLNSQPTVTISNRVSLDRKNESKTMSRPTPFKLEQRTRPIESVRFAYKVLVASCGLITTALLWHFFSSLLFLIKMYDVVLKSYWSRIVFTLGLCSGLLFSMALFLQSLCSVVSYRRNRLNHFSKTTVIGLEGQVEGPNTLSLMTNSGNTGSSA